MSQRVRRDPALYFFGLAALCCLVVSIPATATAMELFHGYAWGRIATGVFEIGAVGAELATLAIPQWRRRLMLLTIALLLATTGANYVLGIDAFLAASLPATYAGVRAAGLGWLLAVIASALFPALLFVFLTAFTARYRMLRGGYATPMSAVAFWLGSAWQVVSARMAEYEQRRAAAEQRAALLEQIARDAEQRVEQTEHMLTHTRAEAEQLSRAYEQQLEHLRGLREQSARDAEHQVRAMRQRITDLEQQADVHEQVLRNAQATATDMERLAAQYGQRIGELEHALNTRPPQLEVEVVTVARYQLTLEQMARLMNASVSTVRRRLPEMATKVGAS